MKHPHRSNFLLRFGGHIFSVTGAKTAGILISSLTFPYLVRRLGVASYGLWSYVVAVCGFMNVLADPGLSNYLTQQLAARREGAFDLIADVSFLRFLASLVAGISVLIIAVFEVQPELRQLLRLFGAGILAVNLISCDYLLTALEMFHVRSLLTVIQQVVYALGIFGFVHAPRDLRWVPVSILVSSAMTAVAGWIILVRHGVNVRWDLRPGRWRGILGPALHYAASSLMSSVYHRTGHLVVRWFLGDFALGIYAAAVRFVDLLRGFVIIVLQVLMPRMALAIESGAGLRRLSRFALAVIVTVSTPLCIGLIVTAPLVVPLVLGKQYLADIVLLRWMAPYLITAPAASLFSGTILFAAGRHRAYLASTAAGALFGAVLYFTLTPGLGLIGAAVAFVLAEVAVAAVAVFKIPELWDSWRNPAIAISLSSALLMLIAVRVANAYTSQAVAVIAAGGAVYLVCCAWLMKRFAGSLSFSELSGRI
jgi:O-antigen/teichoic acid export membrane protein